MKLSLFVDWMKKNWKIVITVLTIAAFMGFQLFSKNKDEKAIRELQKQLTRARKDYNRASRLHREELIRQARIEEQYKKIINDLQIKYGEVIGKLNREKQQQVREIVAQSQNNPRVMAERINSTLGIVVYTRGENP